jgi:hypothetical protein
VVPGSLTLPNASALKVCSSSKLLNCLSLGVSGDSIADRLFSLPKHPVVSIPYPLLSWGLVPYSALNLERPFNKCLNTRHCDSNRIAFPPLRFLTFLTFFSAPCRSRIFHPVTLMGFALQRFSPPTSLSTSRYPSLHSVSPLRVPLPRSCSGRRSVSGAPVSSNSPARSSLGLPTMLFSLVQASSSFDSLSLRLGPPLRIAGFSVCPARAPPPPKSLWFMLASWTLSIYC